MIQQDQCSTNGKQVATYVPTFETKLPPLQNMSKINFALTSLGFKVKAPSLIPVSSDLKLVCSYILSKKTTNFSAPPT